MTRLRPSLVLLLAAAGLLGADAAHASAPTLALSGEIVADCTDALSGASYSDAVPMSAHFFALTEDYRYFMEGYYDDFDLLQVGGSVSVDYRLGSDARIVENVSLGRSLYSSASTSEVHESVSASFMVGGNAVYVTFVPGAGRLLDDADALPLDGDALGYVEVRLYAFQNDAGDTCSSMDSLDSTETSAVVYGPERDSDGDGVSQADDLCPTRSAGGEDADENGCRDSEQDLDRDGVKDPYDRCLAGSDFVDRDADGTPDACDTADLVRDPVVLTVTGAVPALCTYDDGSSVTEDVSVHFEQTYDAGATYTYFDYGAPSGLLSQTTFWSSTPTVRIGGRALDLGETAEDWDYYSAAGAYNAWYHHVDNYYYMSTSVNAQYMGHDEAGGVHYGSLYVADDALFGDARDHLAPGDWTLASYLYVSGTVENDAGGACAFQYYDYGSVGGPFTVTVAPLVRDADGDGVDDDHDACPGYDDQDDVDGDGVAAGCDVCPADYFNDGDGDGSCDSADPCPLDAADDADGDGACADADPCPLDGDDDLDGDAICGDVDACPADAANDADGDGSCADADACPGYDDQDDADADGVAAGCDVCPDDFYNDSDADGRCDSDDVCPLDDADDADLDGACADADPCPLDADDDMDGDGICGDVDACPADAANDADGDGLCEATDNCPGTPNADQLDNDRDGIGNACEPDNDGDGIVDDHDNCPLAANAGQADTDRDGAGDTCDADDDGDGAADAGDACAATPVGAPVLTNGCALEQAYPCAGSWKNHGAYVSAVTHGASALYSAGTITAAQRDGYVSTAAKASCGKK